MKDEPFTFENGKPRLDAARVDATGDGRTVNNVLRHEYRVLTDDEKALMKEIKDMGAEFLSLCDRAGKSRETSIARTKIEEAVMWAVKGLTA